LKQATVAVIAELTDLMKCSVTSPISACMTVHIGYVVVALLL